MSVARAFFTVGGMTMISRATGLVREIMIAALLGAGPIAEAFFVAFRFPNLFRRFFAEGAFNMAFVPLFAKTLEGDGRDAAKDFAEEVMAGLLSFLFVLTLLAQLAMPWVILVIAYGFRDDPDKMSMAVAFARIQFPYLMFMALMAMFGGVLNALGKFAAAAGAPILLNVFMIGGMLAAAGLEGDVGLWLCWAVFFGGVAQFLLVARAASRAGMNLSLRLPRWTPRLSRLVKLGAPAAVAGGVTQINILIGTTIATFFDGAVAWLTYADRIYQLPLGVIGVAIGVALLPELSRQARAGEAEAAAAALGKAVELSLLLTLPAAAALMVIPEEIARMLYGRGAFTEADVAATGMAVLAFAAGLPAYVLIKALSPAFFAIEDTRTPLRFAAISMAVNTVFSIALAPVIGWIAVAIGTALAAYVNAALLWNGIIVRGGAPLWTLVGARVIRMGAASAVMAALVFAAAWIGQDWARDAWLRFPFVLFLVGFGMGVYAVAALGLGAVNRDDLRKLLRRRRGEPEARPADGGEF